VPNNIIKNPTWYHSSLGVTTSKNMPLVGGLCHIQRTSPVRTPWCPSSEDFVTYNGLGMLDNMMPLLGGLCHVQRTWPVQATCCPSSEDFVTYNGLHPLGNMICPSSEDFVTYNGLRPSGSQRSHDKVEHDIKTNDTSRVAPKKWCNTNTQRTNATSSQRISSPQR
jgi:hypothetical protein